MACNDTDIGTGVCCGPNGSAINCTDAHGDVSMARGTRPEVVIVPIIFGLIFVIGIVGNGSLIFFILRSRSMRSVPNIFIVSLAIGDFLLILISVPFSATLYTLDNWPFGELMCKLNNYMQTLSLAVSVFTLTALSGERFMAILKPMSKLTGNPKLVTALAAVGIWCLAAILAVPDYITAKLIDMRIIYDDLDHPVFVCRSYGIFGNNPGWYPRAHAMAKLVLYFAVPVSIIGCFYVMMAIALVRSGKNFPGEGHARAQQQKLVEARKKVAIVVLCLVVIFIICWMPRHIFVIWYYYDTSDFNEFWNFFKILGFCMSFINSCVNPLALYFLSRQFRRYYNRCLFCCCWKLRYRVQGYESSTGVSGYNLEHHCMPTAATTTSMMNQSQTV